MRKIAIGLSAFLILTAAAKLGTVRIPTKSAGDSERRRPPIPIEAGQGFR